MPAFAAVFAYEVEPAGVAAFEAVYGPDGDWARFFRGAAGYLDTQLWRAAEERTPRYLVIDRWRSASAYAAFLAATDEEYQRRNRAAAALWRSETLVGRFETP